MWLGLKWIRTIDLPNSKRTHYNYTWKLIKYFVHYILDDEVKEVLRQAFINVDKAYFESIGKQ